MTIKVVPFATALAVVTAITYVLMVLIALASPGLFLGLYQAWTLLDLSQFAPGGIVLSLPVVVFGLVSMVVAAWLFGAIWALLYNALLGAPGEVVVATAPGRQS